MGDTRPNIILIIMKKREVREAMRDWLVRSNFKTRDRLTDWR